MSDSTHALLNASGSERWGPCAASVRLEAPLADQSSSYASEGTAAHTLGAWVLINGKSAQDYPEPTIEADGRTWPVNSEMISGIDSYAELVRDYAQGGQLLVEQKVNYATHLGVEADLAWGTSDAVILQDDKIVIVDLKWGMGVRVEAEDNSQLMLYALGALYEYEALGDFTHVQMVIVQPRLEHLSEHTIDVTSLKTFALRMKASASRALKVLKAEGAPALSDYAPSEGACRWCKAKAICPALRAQVHALVVPEATSDDFSDLTEVPDLADVPSDALGAAMDKIGLVEDFCTAVRAEVERRLLGDIAVPSPAGGYKIVQGKRGNRAWASESEAEAALKAMRLKSDDIYAYKLKGPAPIEKLLAKDSPTRWKRLQKLITQPEGRPSVAPMSDARPAITHADTALAFEDLT